MRLCPCLYWLIKSQSEGMLLRAPPVRHEVSWHGNWGHSGSSSRSRSRSVSINSTGYYMPENRDLRCCCFVLSVFVLLFCLSLSICPLFFCSLYFVGSRNCSYHKTANISECPHTQAIFFELNNININIIKHFIIIFFIIKLYS